ncbi:MAG: hypothetical protein E7496_06265 [Ruminococcus sp.]|nr:hypothetical protein [Ruminococcus sp.]
MIFLFGILKLLMKILFTVLLIILILIIIICLSSVSAHISFWEGKFEWSIRYFGLKLLPRKKISKKPKSSEKDNKEDAYGKDEKQETEEKPEKLLMDAVWEKMQKFAKRMDMAGNALSALPPALRCFGNALTWYAIETDILIADEDAADCARKYGLMQIIFQNLFSQTGNLMHVKRKNIRIQYDFIEDTCRYNFRCRVKVHIGKTIIAGIVFLWNYFKDSTQAKKELVSQKL